MANAAAKKSAKAGQVTSQKYLPYLLSSSLFYLCLRLLWWYQSSSTWDYIFFFLFSILYLICYFGLIQSAKDNIQGEIYFDIFCVNFLAEIISTFTIWGRVILLLIPGYFLYLGINWYLASKKNTPPPPVESEEPQENTKTEKKKTRIIRH